MTQEQKLDLAELASNISFLTYCVEELRTEGSVYDRDDLITAICGTSDMIAAQIADALEPDNMSGYQGRRYDFDAEGNIIRWT